MLETSEIMPGQKYTLKRDVEYYWLLNYQNLPVTTPERKLFWLSFFEQRDMNFHELEPGQHFEFIMKRAED